MRLVIWWQFWLNNGDAFVGWCIDWRETVIDSSNVLLCDALLRLRPRIASTTRLAVSALSLAA